MKAEWTGRYEQEEREGGYVPDAIMLCGQPIGNLFRGFMGQPSCVDIEVPMVRITFEVLEEESP